MAFEIVGSTNARALEAASAGDPGPLWITAEHQTAGRGRRGRAWASPPGGLYATLLLVDPAAAMADLGNLPLVSAVGLADGIGRLRGIEPRDVAIKWPNDILVGGGKCVGILIETERLPSGALAVAIGAGINLERPVNAQAPYRIAALRDCGFTGSAQEAFDTIAEGLEAALRRWDRGRGFEVLRREWIARATGIGAPCTVRLSDRTVDGRFVELDASGRLVLETGPGRREVFSAGDLFFPAFAPADPA